MKPSMLLGALLALSLPAHAEETSRCTGVEVSACGVTIVKTVCTNSSDTDGDRDEAYERHGSDDGHSARTHSTDIDASDGANTYRKDDRIPPSAYPGHEHDYDFDYTDPRGEAHHVDESERMGTSPDGKITICHRMGGARVTLDVPDDQIEGVRAHGHGSHEMDTLGRCEEQEDASGNDDPAKIAAATKLSENPRVTPSLAACLSAPPGTQVSVTLPDGKAWTGSAPGCNVSGVSCSVPVTLPNRGGVRTLH